jgi:hypothetical protein
MERNRFDLILLIAMTFGMVADVAIWEISYPHDRIR